MTVRRTRAFRFHLGSYQTWLKQQWYDDGSLKQRVGRVDGVKFLGGNLTPIDVDVLSRYFYNAAGQLVLIESKNAQTGVWKVIEFRYDAFGRRILKRDDILLRRFAYAGQDRIYTVMSGLNDPDPELDAITILYTANPLGDDVLSFSNRSGSTVFESRFFHRDEQGSVVEVSRAGGARDHAGASYTSFGSPDGNPEDEGRDAYTGREMDQEWETTGLVFLRNRYYDPNTGRFTQEDPIGLAGGLNLYA